MTSLLIVVMTIFLFQLFRHSKHLTSKNVNTLPNNMLCHILYILGGVKRVLTNPKIAAIPATDD